jgi:hypothetical protein
VHPPPAPSSRLRRALERIPLEKLLAVACDLADLARIGGDLPEEELAAAAGEGNGIARLITAGEERP